MRCFALVLLALVMLSAQAPAPDAQQFDGKIVVVSLRHGDEQGGVLANAEEVEFAGSRFLVGTFVETGHPQEWRTGSRTWFQVADIVQIIEFASVEDFEAAAARAQNPPGQPGPC